MRSFFGQVINGLVGRSWLARSGVRCGTGTGDPGFVVVYCLLCARGRDCLICLLCLRAWSIGLGLTWRSKSELSTLKYSLWLLVDVSIHVLYKERDSFPALITLTCSPPPPSPPPLKTFAHFMSAVGFFMGRNPRVSYHNLYHAVDVMHATYLTLGSMGASGLLTETEQLALILSALCHDLDHPALTNSFQVGGGAAAVIYVGSSHFRNLNT